MFIKTVQIVGVIGYLSSIALFSHEKYHRKQRLDEIKKNAFEIRLRIIDQMHREPHIKVSNCIYFLKNRFQGTKDCIPGSEEHEIKIAKCRVIVRNSFIYMKSLMEEYTTLKEEASELGATLPKLLNSDDTGSLNGRFFRFSEIVKPIDDKLSLDPDEKIIYNSRSFEDLVTATTK